MRTPFPLPWRDRRGRVVPIKALVLVLIALPALLLAIDAVRGMLGARPLTEAIHVTGLWAERLLLVTLALTPLRFVLDWPRLAFIRRICGVGTLCYVAVHLSLYVIDQKFHWGQILWEVFTRFYLIIGFVALIGLLVLGVTSTDAAMRRLGARWKRLHRLAYGIAVLTTVHYLLQTRADIAGPALAFGVLAWLFAWRALPARWGRAKSALLALGILAAGLTAMAESAWYGLATGINWRRVLAANLDQLASLDPFDRLRPSGEAALLAGAVILLMVLRRHLPGLLSRVPSLPPLRPWRAPSR